MLIDSHTHIGTSGQLSISVKILLNAMDEFSVDFALVSSISACEFDTYHRPLPDSKNQTDANLEVIEATKKYPARLAALFWIRPHNEQADDMMTQFFQKHRSFFKGLKAHPYYSKTPFDSDAYTPYLRFAEQNNLPVAVHSASDEWSHPDLILKQARNFPNIPFIMVHMGLYGAEKEAIQAIKQQDNLFGDTSWVKEKVMQQALTELPAEKILFGSDSAIEGKETYLRSKKIIEIIKKECSKQDADKILYQNSKNLFNL